MRKYRSACSSLRPGQLDRLASKIVDSSDKVRVERPIEAITIPFLELKEIIKIYNLGYLSGHHDTVEGVCTPICYEDLDQYHSEEVTELLEDIFKGRRNQHEKV